MVGSMAGYVFNDTLIKLTTEELPLLQVMVVRGVIATLLILVAAAATGVLDALPRAADRRVLLRGTAEIAATFLFLFGLLQLPIANATAIMNAVPLIMTVMAVVFLAEKVGVRRWSAIAVGFAGVLMIVQPGAAGFNEYSLLVCGAAVVIAIRDLMTPGIDPRIPSLIITLVASLSVTLTALAGVLVTGDWQPMSSANLAAMAGAAVLLFAGHHLIIVAMRMGNAPTVAPFRYSVVLWALLSGYVVWGDVPDILAFAGIALIVVTGVYVLRREYRLRRQAGVSDEVRT